MANADVGRAGEEIAARYLERAGMRVVARNWRCAQGSLRGELDIVAWDGPALVFCEVKSRRGWSAGGPLVAVTPRKQQQVRRLALAFLAGMGMRAREIRFDVVGVCWADGNGDRQEHPEISHVQAAW